ncbi:MAG TPA: family 43 glycosylhydrolase, partial [Acidimicrobiales bacterium]
MAPEPSARAGQFPIPIGRMATKGPIGFDPSKADGIQLDVLSGLLDNTPIFNGDFADPFALRTPDGLDLYASNTESTRYSNGAHVPAIAVSRDSGFEGRYLGDALPALPKWTVSGFQWAPSVWTRPDGTYVMYYSTPATIPLGCLATSPPYGCVTTTNGRSSAMCISRATSSSPAGPFVDDSSSALVCPVSQGGAIDPSVFVASDGTPWLLWKSDGDCCNQPTSIYSQQLSTDGLSVVGPAHRLIGASQSWEGGVV